MSNAQIIYDMPDEEYFALERLSSSGIKKLLVSAQDFWKWSWMNEDKEEDKTTALNVGSAYHSRILDGKEAFSSAYAVKPECDRRTKEGKAIYAAFKEQYPDAKEIDEKLRGYIEAAAHRIETKPAYSKFFEGGKKEVTILWEDDATGVPMKARLDCLHEDKIVDLKTFSNSQNHNLSQIVTSHIARYSYYTQVAVYREACEQAGLGELDFYFFFQQAGRDNNALPVNFPVNSLLAGKGEDEMRAGINKFRDMYEKYGTGEWFEPERLLELTDEDFPLWIFDKEIA